MTTADPPPARIPRSADDDHAAAAVAARRDWLAARAAAALEPLTTVPADPRVFRGNIENLFGTVPYPVGVAGPYLIRGQHVEGEVFVPMATTEGALVASYSRGMKAISLSGGVRTRTLSAELTCGATFVFEHTSQALDFVVWLDGQLDVLRQHADATTRHGKLRRTECHPVGRRVFVNFVYDTGDALGINMATKATAAAVAWVKRAAVPPPAHCDLPGGLQGEKWTNARDFLLGRGRRAVAEATITRDVLATLLHAEATRMQAAWLSMTMAKQHAGGLGASFHAANGAAAVMLATGQDLAYLTAFTSTAVMEARPNGDLHLSIDCPTIGVGTVGGGTGLPAQRACLGLMGCVGPGTANRLAEIMAATCLAGEASTVAAIVSGEFVAAHEALGRNRPDDGGARRAPVQEETP
jgi:hydroxymethylglutaryl-CoA reductase (NADPH)